MLVALAALTAAPSALALRPPEEQGLPGLTIVQHQPAAHPAKPKPKQKQPARCKQFGPYCLTASS